MNQNDRSKSPFSELSFSQQQEQWRIFRAQQLDFQAVESKKEPPRAQQRPAEPPPPRPFCVRCRRPAIKTWIVCAHS